MKLLKSCLFACFASARNNQVKPTEGQERASAYKVASDNRTALDVAMDVFIADEDSETEFASEVDSEVDFYNTAGINQPWNELQGDEENENIFLPDKVEAKKGAFDQQWQEMSVPSAPTADKARKHHRLFQGLPFAPAPQITISQEHAQENDYDYKGTNLIKYRKP